MPEIELPNSKKAEELIGKAIFICSHFDHEFLTPEHVLYALCQYDYFCDALRSVYADPEDLKKQLDDWMTKQEKIPNLSGPILRSSQFTLLMKGASMVAFLSSCTKVEVPHIIQAFPTVGEESWALYLLQKALNGKHAEGEFLRNILDFVPEEDDDEDEEENYNEDNDFEDDYDYNFDDMADEEEKQEPRWHKLVTCVSDIVDSHNPLIGRETELERTIQVLCRKDKNNPLHVGEPGVGKTALVYGLAARINKGDVPERLKNCRIYSMDIGSIIAGTQYRGDLEKRIKEVMTGAGEEGNVIIYIDEIHNLIGAGQTEGQSLDASNMLKPYLEAGDIRFIGSTTYEEYNRYFAKSKSIVRRFQQIDIQEPSIEDSIAILKGLQKKYESFHHITYRPDSIEYAVKASAKYIADRFLPDKAIDLIDEAGAYRELHPTDSKQQSVNKELIQQVLVKICKIDAAALREEDNSTLKTLYKRISDKIYGQDEAVKQVVESVEMAKAGLLDDNKPLASLLFVGPTGVGKTEVARVLSKELGIQLVRFDMSEYTEKHAVAKLIGSPAGYVGYEDGGLLTDAIRKTPNCVLLLDEIEKAHSDIYNILLQVMDYARLTDNKGQKADFRNVILIMTSNAGAQYASQASVGFQGRVSRGDAMMQQVKKTFKPEFINRLSGTVVFHDMDKEMALLILRKKLAQLQQKLDNKKVEMDLSNEAEELMLKKGFTAEYGAREMDRVIAHELKPLLMKEILFGKLKKGGKVKVVVENDSLAIR